MQRVSMSDYRGRPRRGQWVLDAGVPYEGHFYWNIFSGAVGSAEGESGASELLKLTLKGREEEGLMGRHM